MLSPSGPELLRAQCQGCHLVCPVPASRLSQKEQTEHKNLRDLALVPCSSDPDVLNCVQCLKCYPACVTPIRKVRQRTKRYKCAITRLFLCAKHLSFWSFKLSEQCSVSLLPVSKSQELRQFFLSTISTLSLFLCQAHHELMSQIAQVLCVHRIHTAVHQVCR